VALAKPIDAVIFDLDGVLLDTEPLYTLATGAVVAEFGKTYEWALKRRVMGRGPLEAAQLVARELELPISAEEYLLRTDAALERLFETTPAMPGAAELLGSLASARVKLGLATSTGERLYALKARRHAWLSHFGVVVCGDDPEVAAAKPAPDIFLVAARRLGVSPSRCVVVEDSVNGVLAAKRAGMQVVALPDPRLDDPILRDAQLVATSHTEIDAAILAVLGD
jgi:pseudouridine 5'-phosphatase